MAKPADIVLTVAGDTNPSITGLKINAAAVNADNYTIAGATITIKSAYLATLAAGDKAFHVLAASNDGAAFDLAVTITVGD